MAEATLTEIRSFFKTGDPERDGAKQFVKEWKALSETEQAYFKEAVASA